MTYPPTPNALGPGPEQRPREHRWIVKVYVRNQPITVPFDCEPTTAELDGLCAEYNSGILEVEPPR